MMRVLKVAAAVLVSYAVAHVVLASVFMEGVEALTGSPSTGLWYAQNAAPAVAVVIALVAGRYAVTATRPKTTGTPRLAVPSAGWYDDGHELDVERWWDGSSWTGATRPRTSDADSATNSRTTPVSQSDRDRHRSE